MLNDQKNSSDTYILITGGIGYIGSHVAVQTLELHNNVIILDNLSNSDLKTLVKIKLVANIDKNDNNKLIFYEGDIRDPLILDTIFMNHKIDTVMHFAALKSVSESRQCPDRYHDVNVNGTKLLLNTMTKYGCSNFIYSSSATVYGDSKSPITEETPTGNNIQSNYGENKYDIEQHLINNSKNGCMFQHWKIVILRYFNPIGAHPSGLLGDDPNGIPNNIFPYMLRVIKQSNDRISNDNNTLCSSPYDLLTVFGDNYNTPDGTCIRDYIHVQDLAYSHVIAYEQLIKNSSENRIHIYNVGTGRGVSVLELITILNDILIKKDLIPMRYVIGSRRDGDVDILYANVDKIYDDISFKTKYDVYQMCIDGLKFISY